MEARTKRWVDSLVELTTLRLIAWLAVVVGAYPGFLKNPWKLANWFDDHLLYAFDEVNRLTLAKYHELPAWNPYWCGGWPGVAQPEDGFYSPDFLLRLAFGSEHGRRLTIILLFVMGMEGTYRLCRRLDSSAVASGFAAIVFGTSHHFVSFIHDGWVHFMSFLLIPWVLLALVNGMESRWWRMAGGFFVAWMVAMPGTYPVPYMAIAFAYWFAFLLGHRLFNGKPMRPTIESAVGIGVFGFLLACCKLVPTVMYMRRFTRIFNPIETHTIMESIAGMIPRYSLVVFFAIAAAVFGDLAAGACVGGALLFFALSMGDYGTLSPFHIMKQMPLLGQLRFPDRFLLMVVFFCALAASRGITRLEDTIPAFLDRMWHFLANHPKLPKSIKMPKTPPRVLAFAGVGLAAILAWKIALPTAEALAESQRAPSDVYVEDPVREYSEGFKQARGNRRDAHIYPALNMGSLYCVAGNPIPESPKLRGDLPQEEYPADPNVAKVTRKSWSPNRIVLDVDAKQATTIYVNQNWAPEWRTDTGTVRSEDKLLAIDVPAGQYTMTLYYRDYVVWLTLLVSLGTLLWILFTAGKELVKKVKEIRAGFDDLPMLPRE